MLRTCLYAIAVVAVVCGPAYSDTFLATITKVDGNKVTYMKATYHAGKAGAEKYTFGELKTVEVAKDVAITRGHFLPVDGDMAADGRLTGKTMPLKGGLEHDAFKQINEGKAKSLRPGLMTIADKGDDKGKMTGFNFWSSASPK